MPTIFNLDNFSKKMKFKCFKKIYTQRRSSFLLISLTTLHEKYVDWPNLTEQKPSWAYTMGGRNKFGRYNESYK